MNIRLPIALFALLAFTQSLIMLPAAADSNAPINQPAIVAQSATDLEACPTNLNGANLAQVTTTECCKGHKGLCGCRAGKLVCCDGTVSNEPGCTCHGDEGVIE